MGRTDLLARRRILFAASALFLAACDVTSPPTGSRGEPEPTDPEALLTDAQIVTPTDAAAQPVDAPYAAWIAANHHTIRSLTSHRHDDLRFLGPVLAGKRLVQLGESGHGVREFNQAKTRLIRYLHEEQGFNVLAFESGLFECWMSDREAAQSPATETMAKCIFGVWHTEEVRELFEYVRETHQTSRPLRLAGFDVQLSSAGFADESADLLREVVGKVDAEYAARVRTMDSLFTEDYLRMARMQVPLAQTADSIVAIEARGRLLARYDSLGAFLDARQAQLAAAYASDPTVPLIARQYASSRRFFIREMMTAGDFRTSSSVRDEGMAANVSFLLEKLYPAEKVIVWAHNAHIQHDRAAQTRLQPSEPLPESMGRWLAERHRAELYTVGLFMYRGQAANNARQPYLVSTPLANSIEALFYTVRKRWTFVDMRGAPRSAGTEWMYDRYLAKEWGVNYHRIVPRDQFDGILFIDTVHPPDYI
jgi:erythromycin esterase